MAWDPTVYNKFKSARFAPFHDLIKLVSIRPDLNVVDLGCGTGELTRKLADLLPNANVLGIDSSLEMLDDSRTFENHQLKFEQKTIEEQLHADQKWDLVFSNAAIQWVENHEKLIPQIMAALKPGGQLLIQIPNQPQNTTNQLLSELAVQEPFGSYLQKYIRASPVLTLDEYAQLFFENGCKSMTVYEKIYPLILENSNALFDWVSGTALIPYIERLDQEAKAAFIFQYKEKLRQRFPKNPVFYPFKRILMEASF